MAVTLAGCAPATVRHTNVARDYVAKPGRMFVISVSGMGWGREFADGFREQLEQIGAQCNTAVGFEEISGLELSDRDTATRANQFGADTLLFIQHGGGVVMMPGGNRVSIRYLATLQDRAQRRNVWRGEFDFGRGGTVIPLAERGAVFAIDLSNGMKEDGILSGPDCRPIALGRNFRLEGASTGTVTPVRSPAPAASASTSPAAPAAPAAPASATPASDDKITMQALDALIPAAPGTDSKAAPSFGASQDYKAARDRLRRQVEAAGGASK